MEVNSILWLFILPIPISCIAWTVTHEEILREPHEYCVNRSKQGKNMAERKFFYLFTCEYCFSHYVTILMLFITHYTLFAEGWKGYLIAGFSLVWISNLYMSIFEWIRLGLKSKRLECKIEEKQLTEKEKKANNITI